MLYLLPFAQLDIFLSLLFSPYCFSLSWSILYQIFPSVFQYLFQPLTLFTFSSSTMHFSPRFFLFPLLCSVPPPSPSLTLSHYFPALPLPTPIPFMEKNWIGKLTESISVRGCSFLLLLYGCLVTRSLHLYLFLPSASTTHLNNWIIIEAQDVSNKRVALLTALTYWEEYHRTTVFLFQLLVKPMWTAVQNLFYFCNVTF